MLDKYSSKLQKALKTRKIDVGDRIAVFKGEERYEGLLMPKASGDSDAVVIKLDSGYNIGIDFKDAQLKKLEKKSKKSIAEKKPMFDKTKPPVSIISTGGTITSKVDYHTGGVTALIAPEEILVNIPELSAIANIREIIRPFTKMSEDMNYADWQNLAEIIAKELNKDNKGVIVTHGTDTLHFTSAALSFMLKNLTKPVVLVGAQRSPDRGSSDATMNLICSVHAALSDIAEVGICMHGTMNDDYCIFTRGTKVRKMHTTRRDAFRPINAMPLAKILPSGNIEIMSEYRKRSDGRVIADVKFEEKVALLKVYPGSEPSVMEYLIKKGYKGFVLEATALGHVPVDSKKSWIPAIKSVVNRGMPVIITSQSLYGRVDPYVYSNLRILAATGAIFAEDMLAEVAYVKLGWVLGHTKKPSEIKKQMLTNVAGEISEKIDPRTFLY